MRKFEGRETQRHQLPDDLTVVYEGASEAVPVHPVDLSTRGMFIPTPRLFPIGSVLKISFRLQRTNFRVNARAEVRHCTPGSGVGVEFLELSPEAKQAIEKEIRL
jgi:PilZ domain